MSNLFDIKDLNFVIAGGLGQVGLKLSEHLEKNGSKMVILDLFDKKKLVSLKKKNLFLSSKKIKILSVDISKKSKIEKSLNKITNFLKRINVLVNLAAVDTKNKSKFDKKINFHNFPDKSLRKSIDVNLIGSLNLSQIFCKYFVKNNIAGNIINVAFYIFYCWSKFSSL